MMRSTTKRENKDGGAGGFVRRLAAGAGVLAFWLAVWQGISMLVGQELLVPAPLAVARTFGRRPAVPCCGWRRAMYARWPPGALWRC